ncbi:hypothetical protein J4I25_000907 [Salmonella enterica]|nr:hypothetical protein [Salmonella enterica]EDX4410276.1 hypothetical protein [Salmonella enterica subsp. houtenae serovar 44:z36,[z38]:-]EAY1902155.1 hypothetical protein [Salmonella enterica]EAY1915402.1 hypothetical protein [Salmonella enterica]EAY1964196.1 hypothetical protein [Salmonella enterica]
MSAGTELPEKSSTGADSGQQAGAVKRRGAGEVKPLDAIICAPADARYVPEWVTITDNGYQALLSGLKRKGLP